MKIKDNFIPKKKNLPKPACQVELEYSVLLSARFLLFKMTTYVFYDGKLEGLKWKMLNALKNSHRTKFVKAWVAFSA